MKQTDHHAGLKLEDMGFFAWRLQKQQKQRHERDLRRAYNDRGRLRPELKH